MLTADLCERPIIEGGARCPRLEDVIATSGTPHVRLTKLPTATVYRVNGRRAFCRGPADFMGLCLMSRRLILFDACEASGRRRLILDERSLPEMQRQILLSYGRDGAVAGLLAAARHPQLQMIFWVPWPALIDPPCQLSWTDDRLIELGPLDGHVDFSPIPGVI